MRSVWTERDLQEYRAVVCSCVKIHDCESCTKTKEEIIDCYWDLSQDMEDGEDASGKAL